MSQKSCALIVDKAKLTANCLCTYKIIWIKKLTSQLL